MEQSVVVAVDASNQASEAIHVVKYYVEKMHRPGNKLILVYCIDISESSLPRTKDGHIAIAQVSTLLKPEEEKVQLLEEKMKEILLLHQIPGVLRTLMGRPGDVVLQVAHEANASMIVVGSRCTGMMRRTLLGNVTEYIVNHAYVPVMVCRSSIQHIEGSKTRHLSGESLSAFTASIRKKFSSGGKAKSHSSQSMEKEEGKDKKKENKEPAA